jgi:hypothetical protein
MATDPIPAAIADEIMGVKCPDCGWRGEGHRPPIKVGEYQQASACPRWTPTEEVLAAKRTSG